jgi:hypothetical protein
MARIRQNDVQGTAEVSKLQGYFAVLDRVWSLAEVDSRSSGRRDEAGRLSDEIRTFVARLNAQTKAVVDRACIASHEKRIRDAGTE